MNIRKSHLLVATTVAAIVAVAVPHPPGTTTLESARVAVHQVESSPDAGKYAAAEVTAAHEALQEADQLVAKKKSKNDIEQAAYLAETSRRCSHGADRPWTGEQKTAQAEAERQKVVSQARETEAAAARIQAEAAKQKADADRTAGAIGCRCLPRRNAASLEAQLRDLQAKQTDRGLVLTLGDVLFDSGQATLKPGAASTIDRTGGVPGPGSRALRCHRRPHGQHGFRTPTT